MPTPNVFASHSAGDILPASDWNNSFSLVEASFGVVGPYIQAGLVPTAGTGLAANISSGNALIGANIVKSGAWSITALANGVVNDLYMLQNGTGTSLPNPSSQPANSVKLGTATTAGGVVTSVNTGRSSGRQQFVAPQNLVHGGLALGITSAGHPASLNLAAWAASPGEGVQVSGVLPSGAVPAPSFATVPLLAPASIDRNLIQPAADNLGPSLILRGHSATDFSDPQQWQDWDGTVRTTVLWGGGWVVAPVIGNRAIDVDSPVGQNTAVVTCHQGFTPFIAIYPPGFGVVADFSALDTGDVVLELDGAVGQTADFIQCWLDGRVFDVTALGDAEFRRKSSTTADRMAHDVTVTWATSTDASRKARSVFNIWDTAAREALRLEASGSAPMIGFLGATAVVRQTGGAATAGGTYTATEQGMIQRTYDAMRAYGLLT